MKIFLYKNQLTEFSHPRLLPERQPKGSLNRNYSMVFASFTYTLRQYIHRPFDYAQGAKVLHIKVSEAQYTVIFLR